MMNTEQLWASLPIPVLLVNDKDEIQAINPAAEGFFNASSRSMSGAPLWDKVAVNAPLEEAFERCRRNQSSLYVNDVDVGSGNRAPLQCNIQIAPFESEAGSMLILIQPREFSGRVGTRGSSNSAAKSAIGMAEMLAHEIKNPLAGITGAAQLLSMSLPQEDLELTDLIVAETRRIVKLLEQVEQFGNLRPPEKNAVNIHDVLDRARKSAAVSFGAHIRFVEDYDPSLPYAYCDADQLLQVMLNLIKNACEASDGRNGEIRLRTFYEHSLRLRRSDGSGNALPLQIEIQDDGPGLPEDIATDIFDPFISGRENGTGLGLALVSKIIADHGGWVGVESVPGRTVFRISLPVAPRTKE